MGMALWGTQGLSGKQNLTHYILWLNEATKMPMNGSCQAGSTPRKKNISGDFFLRPEPDMDRPMRRSNVVALHHSRGARADGLL
jgi:hypothetical protein